MIEPERYIENSVALLASLVPITEPAPGVVRGEREHVTRFVTTKPVPSHVICSLVAAEPRSKAVVAEDSFGVQAAGPLPEGVVLKHMPVMVRSPGPIAVTGEATRVDAASFADATKVIVDGFPAIAGFPPSILELPGWHFWLSERDGLPAAAGYGFDDGRSVGIYLLATLPEHRGHGLARAIMTHTIAACPTREAVLVATLDGQPLYGKLGFKTVSMATWYMRR